MALIGCGSRFSPDSPNYTTIMDVQQMRLKHICAVIYETLMSGAFNWTVTADRYLDPSDGIHAQSIIS
jgi:hypothetical protein